VVRPAAPGHTVRLSRGRYGLSQAPDSSAARRAEAEGVAVRVDHHPPQFLVGLFRGLGRSKLSGVLGRLLQVIDAEVQVVLLGMLLARPRWTRLVLDPLEVKRYSQCRCLSDPVLRIATGTETRLRHRREQRADTGRGHV
jgi:hypothetical protein